ncbi:MAG: hypothetical protein N2053_01765 [Chitinispirillaceae bacterium]|nr:hypothetical protein [Chitinispirillaceae bacterium]
MKTKNTNHKEKKNMGRKEKSQTLSESLTPLILTFNHKEAKHG